MAVVSDIITEAFLDLGAIAAGQTPTTEEQTDAFLRLNQMIRSWSNEDITIFTESHSTYTLTAGTYQYTFGASSANWGTSARPVRLVSASAVSGAFRAPVKVMSFQAFENEIENPYGVTAVLPQALAVDNAFPNLNVKVFPTPAAGGNVELDYWTEIAQFATVGDTVNLPPGFEDALHFNLAVRLYPQYARSSGADQGLLANAQMTKNAIARLNTEVYQLQQPARPAPAKEDNQQ
jgi:hypothetical protein